MQGGAERGVSLGEVDDAELAGPGEDVLEEVVVDGAEMGGVEAAGDPAILKLSTSLGDEWGYKPI